MARDRPQPALLRLYSGSTRTPPAQLHSGELAEQQTKLQQAAQREAAAAEVARKKDAEERAARRAQLQQKDAELKQSIEECSKARRAAPA